MKKIASLVGVLSVLAAGSAMAGTDLGWDDCLAGGPGGGGGAATKAVNCSNSALASPVMFLSFTAPAEIPQLGASDDIIDFQAPNTLGSWWLAGTTRFAAGLGPSTCPGWFDAAPNGGVLFGPNIVQTSPSRLRVRNVISVATGQEQDILAGSEFLTHTVTIKFNNTAPATFGNAECIAGAAIACPSMLLQQPGAGTPTTLTSPDVTNCVTWRTPAGQVCPAATPTKKATWGAIKALYR